jgi:hypothetical protein
LTTPDWFTDCRTMFNRHPCTILSAFAAFLFSVLVWYAGRMETKTEAIDDALHLIQMDVAVIRARSMPAPVEQPAPRGGIAMVDADK